MQPISDSKAPLRLSTVGDVSKQPGYDWLTPSGLRHLIFNAEDRVSSDGTVIPGNGLAPAILRVGRRVLIDLNDFEAWIETHRCGRDT